MKRRLFVTRLSLAAGLLASPLALARSVPPPGPRRRLGGLAQISVVDRASGRELPIHRHRGEYWVAGAPGARYAIRVRNGAAGRVMAVMSVDGVNVVSGETAGHDQVGYVFGAGDSSDIAGWRKSDAQIAAFEFTAPGRAYASRTGRPDHLGVIGVALFREREPLPPALSRRREAAESEQRAEAPAADAAASARAAPGLGTGHGRRETSHVGRTHFERAQAAPDETIRIRYDSRERLIAAGIIPMPRPDVPAPDPFPASDVGYVPDPPGR